MWLFCGLGNPGKEYEKTRHNFGFLVVDMFAKQHKLTFKFYRDLESEATFYKDLAIIVKPLTYMNLSGRSVKKWIERERIALDKLVVIHDDLDLPLGRIKILPKGGAGGHKGVLSIIENLGTSNFPRMKLGIGRPQDGDTVKFVLSPFSEEEKRKVEKILVLASQAIDEIIFKGLLKAMTLYNSLEITLNES